MGWNSSNRAEHGGKANQAGKANPPWLGLLLHGQPRLVARVGSDQAINPAGDNRRQRQVFGGGT